MAKQEATPPIWVLPGPPERNWGLGRPEIVRAAVRLADAGGTDAPPLRAIAKELGASTPMSLYRYVHNKDGLLDLMLDAANAEVPTPERPGDDWRAELTAVAADLWAMTKRHPWFARLVHQRPPVGPHATRREEFLLATFDRLGQDLPTAQRYARLVEGHVIGQALQWSDERRMWQDNVISGVDDARRQARSWFPADDNGAHPLVDRARREFLAATAPPVDGNAQFDLGLACLLEGIANRLR
ncbi:MAG: TetR/AcrR family transcriptional regulator [Umezawaea sp.]